MCVSYFYKTAIFFKANPLIKKLSIKSAIALLSALSVSLLWTGCSRYDEPSPNRPQGEEAPETRAGGQRSLDIPCLSRTFASVMCFRVCFEFGEPTLI
jgi:hypothetical protein